jgi:predicted transposase YdaD
LARCFGGFCVTFEQKYDQLLNYDKKMGIEEIAKRIAHREGLQEGRQEGLQEGRQEAMSEAEAAIRNDRKTTVLNMRKIGFSAEKIADIVGYSLEDVLSFFKEADDKV